MRRNLTSLYESLCFLDDRVHEQDKLLKVVAKENEACQRLMKVPGIGIMTATILLTIAGVARTSKTAGNLLHSWGLCRVKTPPAAKSGFWESLNEEIAILEPC